MKTSQLRLGNLIKIKKPILKDLIDEGFKKIYTDRTTVIYVGYDYLGVIIDNSEVEIMLQDIEPIPLTEEWLLKFHPNAMDLSNQIFSVGRFKLIWKFSYEYWYVINNITGAYMTKIEFVHEWQNFWHIMNGEELTLKQTESI